MNLLCELKETAPDDYKNFLRMDNENYQELLSLVTPFLEKKATKMRDDVITVHQKLSTTLRFLATGQSYEDLKFLTRIAPQTIGQFILPTCNAITSVLNKKQIIKTPTTKDE